MAQQSPIPPGIQPLWNCKASGEGKLKSRGTGSLGKTCQGDRWTKGRHSGSHGLALSRV